MKKLLLTAVIAVSLISSAFAKSGTEVSNKVKNSFRDDFQNIKDVQWSAAASYFTASFVSNDKRINAFYDFSGVLIGTSQAISIESLPATAKRAFAKKYSNYIVKEAIRFDKSDETSYFISAENGNESIVLQVINGYISIFKKS
jgi:opacity protein-like surface antigen